MKSSDPKWRLEWRLVKAWADAAHFYGKEEGPSYHTPSADNETKLSKARSEIKFMMRQIGSEPFPKKVPMSPALRDFIDEPAAQRLYEEIIADLERKIGRGIERR